jgi:hypothetical protein
VGNTLPTRKDGKMSGANKEKTAPAGFDLVVFRAAEEERRNRSLLSGSDLQKLAHTPENEAAARARLDLLNQSTKLFVRMSLEERGMILYWFRLKYGANGNWISWCDKNLPDMPRRTISHSILSYRIAIGEKKPKELTYTEEDLKDPELIESACDPEAGKIDYAPRSILNDQIRRLQMQNKTGGEQLQAARQQLDELKRKMDELRASLFTPKEVRDEEQRMGLIRCKFGEFLMFWNANFSPSLEAMRMHKSMIEEFEGRIGGFWNEQMAPHCEKLLKEQQAKRIKP